MPETIRRQVTFTAGGVTFVSTDELTSNGVEGYSPSVPAAKAGTLTTRTDADTGVATMSGGHGIVTNNVVDVFWADGSRRAMTATVATNAVTIDGGSGDDLPAVNTAVAVMVPYEIDFTADGDEARAVLVKSQRAGYVVLQDAGGDINTAVYELAANEGTGWIEGGGTNPIANTTVTGAKFSHGDTSAARTMTVEIYMGTP